MWIISPEHDTDVNWLAVGFGNEPANKLLYEKLAQDTEFIGFNRTPSLKDGETATITSFDFDLMIKVTASMTSYSRAALKVKI